MKRIIVAVLAAVSVLSFGTAAMAKVDWKTEPKQKQKQRQSNPIFVGAAITNGGDADFGVGARIEYPLDVLLPNLSIAGSFNYFPSPGIYSSFWEFNANALYSFPVSQSFTPYVGAGLNYASWKDERSRPGVVCIQYDYWGNCVQWDTISWNDSGAMTSLNVIGGCKFDFGIGFTPFIEARLGVGDNEQFEITAGGLFGF